MKMLWHSPSTLMNSHSLANIFYNITIVTYAHDVNTSLANCLGVRARCLFLPKKNRIKDSLRQVSIGHGLEFAVFALALSCGERLVGMNVDRVG